MEEKKTVEEKKKSWAVTVRIVFFLPPKTIIEKQKFINNIK